MKQDKRIARGYRSREDILTKRLQPLEADAGPRYTWVLEATGKPLPGPLVQLKQHPGSKYTPHFGEKQRRKLTHV